MSYLAAVGAQQLASSTGTGLAAASDSGFLANHGKSIGIFLSIVYFCVGSGLSYTAFKEYMKDPKKSQMGLIILAVIAYLLVVIDVGYMWISRDDPDKDKVNKYIANIALIPFYFIIVAIVVVIIGAAFVR
jgi:hypothetical protein